MNIVGARPENAMTLTTIAFAAKRHWGYPERWISAWKDALTITPDYIREHPTFVAWAEERSAGFCALKVESAETWLDHLWVLPDAMGRGVGRALFAHAEEAARGAGAAHLNIVGDPHAEGFYARMGAMIIGREAAPMDGRERYLPLLVKVL